MQHNDPGREPTEPTDAALLRDVRALVRVAKEWSAQPAGSEREIKAQFPLYDTIARLPSDITDRLRIDPMPNRPAPDEVAQLHGGMCPQIVAGNFIVQCNGIVRDKAGVLLFQLEDYAPLTARVAELAAELAAVKGSCRIVLGFGKAIISDASISGILDGAPTTLLFQTVDEEHTIGMDATGHGRDNLEPGDGNVQIVFTKAESVDVVMDALVKIKGAIEAAPGKEPTDA